MTSSSYFFAPHEPDPQLASPAVLAPAGLAFAAGGAGCDRSPLGFASLGFVPSWGVHSAGVSEG
jgi:hypothetical protein